MPLEIWHLIDYSNVVSVDICVCVRERFIGGTATAQNEQKKKTFAAQIAPHTTRKYNENSTVQWAEMLPFMWFTFIYYSIKLVYIAFCERFLMNVPSIYRNDIWLNSPLNLLLSIRKGYFDVCLCAFFLLLSRAVSIQDNNNNNEKKKHVPYQQAANPKGESCTHAGFPKQRQQHQQHELWT